MDTVYIEVILLDNFLLDYVILYLAARFSLRRVGQGRLLCGSAAGAVYAVLAVLFPLLAQLPFKLVASALMCLPIAPRRSWRGTLRTLAAMYAVTFLFAGCAFAWMYASGGSLRDGAVYIDFSVLRYVLGAFAVGALLYEFVLARPHLAPLVRYEVAVEVAGERFVLIATLDTGNDLCDLSGGGVIIADRSTVLASVSDEVGREIACFPNSGRVRTRPFYISTAAGGARLVGFMPENLLITKEEGGTYRARAYIALADGMARDGCSAVLPPGVRITKN